MNAFSFTLLSDGVSDQVLMPILIWLLRRHGVVQPIQPTWSELRRVPNPPQGLSERIALSIDLYPCDLLFIHRDAEGMTLEVRRAEIREALAELANLALPAVCVVPVRMQEAWLLFEEQALRRAAGNPNGDQPLAIPRVRDLEALPDPKEILYELLREASGLRGRRRRRFPVQTAARRVVESMDDFTPLLQLKAFRVLDGDVQETVQIYRWNEP